MSYTPMATYTATGNTFKDTYGSGRVVGKACGGVDGILGIGSVDLTEIEDRLRMAGTVSKTTTVPTVTDNLYFQGTIPTESSELLLHKLDFARSFVLQPSTSTEEVANGELTFGGTDNADYSSDISYTSITSTSPANDTTPLTSAGIVDTCTTLFMIASDAFATTTGLLTVTGAQYEALESMYLTMGDLRATTFQFTPNAQIWPRSLNSQLGGESDKIYLITADIGTTGGQGLDFIDGFVSLQRFCSVFSTTNSRVGMVNTKYTYATTN
ncbi:hypothetical protein FISHEDRAFT_67044 [Fistulina hepatica ATCC 64428]|uniref:Peptidase A1 domain-containing protein n=1 Tax=Fistulina hepatica ATCC 64428 TaxID=1128425 RepID=A0A0D7A447_9AGAR|nr:hypothetical protein FISHEDRAFT_67044 [Fistulina hepatica ATCC 64428]